MALREGETAELDAITVELMDPNSPLSRELMAALLEYDGRFDPMIWAIEASEGKAPWQSRTSIADDHSRWHLWPGWQAEAS